MVLSVPVVLLFFSNCKKDQFGSGPLAFSADTLTFDTVFTTLGSTTQYFKVFNNSKKELKIENIQLAHLVGTQFRMNVDGIAGDHFTNVVIPPKDSIYVFVEVTVNPNDKTSPFVIIDNVNFSIGGKTQTVFLQAFGQNAHFHYGQVLGGNTTWHNDLPHVIINHGNVPGVLVDCGATLTIDPGCQILFASNSAIFVAGTLDASHPLTWQDSIVFRGVRLEQYYNDQPGQWFGIVFLRNDTCVPVGKFKHCVINESSYGIYAGAGLSNDLNSYLDQSRSPNVFIDNCIVKNTQNNALYGFDANITATNSLFYAAGDNLVKLGLGGNYNFTNCTMYNTGSASLSHQKEVLLLSNFIYVQATNTSYVAPLATTFNNCLIYGNLTNEISFNNIDADLTRFNNNFINSAMKTPSDTLGMNSTTNNTNLFNMDPLLKNPGQNDFTPSDTNGVVSPLIDYCPPGLPKDIFDNPRNAILSGHTGTPVDIGAVEKQ
ncbi:MAG: hypothetical protein JWO06_2966 [Bacteroidota bacterium]|nr:hypothetical protein [Bacteroidota bacterium]